MPRRPLLALLCVTFAFAPVSVGAGPVQEFFAKLFEAQTGTARGAAPAAARALSSQASRQLERPTEERVRQAFSDSIDPKTRAFDEDIAIRDPEQPKKHSGCEAKPKWEPGSLAFATADDLAELRFVPYVDRPTKAVASATVVECSRGWWHTSFVKGEMTVIFYHTADGKLHMHAQPAFSLH